jgi:hypothetical protein
MADSTKLRVTELDFDALKSNLKTFLQSQTEFTDYDFEGSSLSVLLDLLSYNTHYNAIYANLVANEMFLDSASKRSSVVSLAKHFGYSPRSVVSARAKVNLTVITTGNPQSLYLPRYAPFTTTIDSNEYTFYNLNAFTVSPISANTFYYPAIEITEGTPLTYRYTVQNGQSKFAIPNTDVDTSTLTVEIQNSGTDATTETFNLAGSGDFVSVTSTDPVYFLEETTDGSYQIVFGDGNVGKKLKDGNIVRMTYLVSNGTAANDATSFTFGSVAAFNLSGFNLTLAQKAGGGKDRETIDSIRHNATKFFVTQNRAVTAEDYKNIVVSEYPELEAVSAWGGDTATPPVYGKVYISAKPTNGTTLTTEIKDKLTKILNRKNVVGITPEFVDPEYLYLTVDTTFFYDPSKTTSASSTIETNINQTIKGFRDSDLDNFDAIFRKSRLSRLIDYTDKSILNSNTNIVIYKVLPVNTEQRLTYVINFLNPIERLRSTAFRIQNDSKDYFMRDDGDGNIIRFHINFGKEVIDSTNFGVINYKAGRLTIPSVSFSLLTENCKIFADPVESDVDSSQNQIITILDSDIKVTGRLDTRKPLVR